jgi:UDP-N-acetylmuramoylalanine--D-glutamate ligase
VVAALETFPRSSITLILGGADRGLDFTPLVEYLTARHHGPVDVIAVGPAGARWLREGSADTRLAANFAEAMAWVRGEPGASEVVLLSPGAPSFDEFASYEERSAAFRAAAMGQPMAEDAP